MGLGVGFDDGLRFEFRIPMGLCSVHVPSS